MTGPRLEVRALEPGDAAAVERLFSILAEDEGTLRVFHPHPLDTANARRVSTRRSQSEDIYFGAFIGEDMVGYGMLRGWEDGYAVPSFGVAVSPRHRGAGIGRVLLEAAVDMARTRGATEMMLKVYPNNHVARRLYESRGFVFEHEPAANQLVGRLRLD